MTRRIAVLVALAWASGCTRANPEYLAPDLASADLATGSDDAGDLAVFDLTTVDLTPPPGSLIIDDITVKEGDSGTRLAVFTIRLSSPVTSEVTVDVHTVDGTALAGVDYEANTATLSIDPGQTVATFAAVIDGDTLYELNETFSAVLDNAVGAAIFRDSATCTIIDDDPAPSLGIDNAMVLEGDVGITALVFTATLSTVSGAPTIFSYATSDGSARVADGDYLAVQGQLTIPPGVTSASIQIPVQGDVRNETDETLGL